MLSSEDSHSSRMLNVSIHDLATHTECTRTVIDPNQNPWSAVTVTRNNCPEKRNEQYNRSVNPVAKPDRVATRGVLNAADTQWPKSEADKFNGPRQSVAVCHGIARRAA